MEKIRIQEGSKSGKLGPIKHTSKIDDPINL
jgi:hypothetical protein